MAKDTLGNNSEDLTQTPQEINRINERIPDANVNKSDIKDKFDAFKDAYKHNRDLTVMSDIERDDDLSFQEIDSRYSQEEIDLFDSINHSIITNTRPDFIEQVQLQSQQIPKTPVNTKFTSQHSITNYETEEEREMRIFKQQLLMLDSITRDPQEEQERLARQQRQQLLDQQLEEEASRKAQKVDVTKSSNKDVAFFNTIQHKTAESYIKAIIDEEIKVIQDSRVRIRIMDDINVGGRIVEKGSYIHGIISGFQTQRVLIDIESIMIDDQIYPVDLVVYDGDGLEGMYVPGSSFTDFTKDLGGDLSSSNTISLQTDDGSNDLNDLMFGLANQGIQSTTRAASKASRKNRAKLKYNSIIYLVTPEEL